VKGFIVFNGNIKLEVDFINKFKERILFSNHIDPKVKDSKKVLLITAAWQKREFYEGHVKEALNDIGIESDYSNGFDENIQNLSVYNDFNEFKRIEPKIYNLYHSKQETIKNVKSFYREKNLGLILILKKQLSILRKTFHHTNLHKALSYNVELNSQKLNLLNELDLLYHYACQDIQDNMNKLRENDLQMIKVCKEIDEYFFTKSNVLENPTYKRMKKELEERILSSNSIFIFGGHVAVLYNRLNFFKLKDAFIEANRRGTNFYTVSAGSLCLCDNLIISDSVKTYNLELFDIAFGLVKKIQLFPHCKDYINMEDSDTITYIAERFNHLMCVGMDQQSFLLLETYEENGQEYERFVSKGKEEGLYIFDKTGKIITTDYKEELVLAGTKFYQNVI